MKNTLKIQKFHDDKFGKRLRILTEKELIGVIGEDGGCEFMTIRPVRIDILTQIVVIGQNFELFYNIQKGESHVS